MPKIFAEVITKNKLKADTSWDFPGLRPGTFPLVIYKLVVIFRPMSIPCAIFAVWVPCANALFFG